MKFHETKGLKRSATKLSVVALCASLALSGCDEQIALSSAAVDPSDNCSQFRQVIAKARTTDIEQQQTAAAVGALFGAVMGASVAGQGNKTQGALLGAAAGGLVGLSATYYQQKAQRTNDANVLLRSVNSDANTERGLVTQTGKAAVKLRSCRRGQIATLTKQVKAGSIDKATARSRLKVVQSRVSGDNQIISASLNGIGQRVTAYVDARSAVAQASGAISAQRARSSTPNVSRVQREINAVVATDNQAKAQQDAELEALRVLLS